MPTPNQRSPQERRALSRLRQILLRTSGIAHGSLVRMERRCGRPNCHCVQGEKHASWYLSLWEEGRTRMVYIPRAWEERVRQWVEHDKEVRELLLELSRACVERLRQRQE